MRQIITLVVIGLLVVGSSWPETAHAAEMPAVASVPGQTAIESPAPQPPQPESTIKSMTPPMPGEIMRAMDGTPLLVVEFELDHHDIPKAFQPQLNAFGSYLKDHPQTTAQLTGYADNSGHGPANGTLSQKRADTVMAYLLSHYGISEYAN